MWTNINFRGRGKTNKAAWDIYMSTLDTEFERDWPIGLDSTFGDGNTDRQIHTNTQRDIVLKHFLDSGSDVEWKIIKKSNLKILMIAILSSLLMSLESKNKLV